ncbi:Alpha/Beta hydrolase protein [Triangularia verruculosa]|uniref:Alpha/Beta hydrolase protein n=1 Tax=Triangularia verruculosa TaxID=2587418 RepID=A0AAN6X8V4_9PEZI|nr:Alpha/Beta hydrolase protein [Triangularia verruculosa]
MTMEYSIFSANDGTTLAFQSSLPLTSSPSPANDTVIIFLHGFSGSSAYFARNFPTLSQSSWILALDTRGHGRSGHSKGGYHVARLASDLRDFLLHIRSLSHAKQYKTTAIGQSIGAAILWTYIELFGDSDFTSFIFVDQAPLQDRDLRFGWDETKAHRGCYDEKSMLAAQEAWVERPEGTYIGLVDECLGYRYRPSPEDKKRSPEEQKQDEQYFTDISRACDGKWLARLLADHTRYDHREAIELITKPTLVLAGRRSGCFSLEGMGETVERVKNGKGANMESKAQMSIFESGHWLFWEEPERFNREVLEWVGRWA